MHPSATRRHLLVHVCHCITYVISCCLSNTVPVFNEARRTWGNRHIYLGEMNQAKVFVSNYILSADVMPL